MHNVHNLHIRSEVGEQGTCIRFFMPPKYVRDLLKTGFVFLLLVFDMECIHHVQVDSRNQSELCQYLKYCLRNRSALAVNCLSNNSLFGGQL